MGGREIARSETAHARHALDIVETAYSLDGTEPEWLGRVLDATAPDIERGGGSYAFTCRVGDRQIEIGPAYIERKLDPRFSAVIADLNRTVPDLFFDLLARSTVLCGAFTSLAPATLASHFATFGPPRGIHDAFSLFAQDGEGYAINLTAPSHCTFRASPRVRGIWKRVGLHVASAMRLRRRLAEARASRDALFSPSGTLKHAEGDLRDDRDARKVLADAVRAVERARTAGEREDPDRALRLWTGLVAGEWSLVDRWESDGRRYVAAYRNRPDVPDPRGLTALERVVLRYVALGSANKEIGFVLGLSESTVATVVGRLLKKLRCKRRSELLALGGNLERARHVALDVGGDAIEVLSVPHVARGDALASLSPAEREIVAGVLAGKSNEQIAALRRTSVNTVANQIRGVFEKLDVGSRAQLVRALTCE